MSSQRLVVVVDPGVRVYGHLHMAGETAPLLLLFHGNGELAADYTRLAGLLTQVGFSLFVVDYRGYGMSEGDPSTSHLLGDAVTIFDALPELVANHDSRPKQIFVMGRSLGSAAACELAFLRGREMAGLIIESGFASTRPLLALAGVPLANYQELRDGHGNGMKIARFSGPTLILHGQDDTLILPDQARTLYLLSEAPIKRLVIIPNAGHNNLMSAGYADYSQALQWLLNAQSTTRL
ncbi:MAG TPA: alpha/beta fold hydrolase [Bryobacteraceae bacterium]